MFSFKYIVVCLYVYLKALNAQPTFKRTTGSYVYMRLVYFTVVEPRLSLLMRRLKLNIYFNFTENWREVKVFAQMFRPVSEVDWPPHFSR